MRNNNQEFSLIVSTSALNLNLVNYYWIGSSGDWNNGSNWSLSSGGNTANSIPGIRNPIVFDNNSFTNPNNNINLSSTASCYSINYYSTNACNINLSSFAMNIDGSIFDENKNITFKNGKLSFKGIISKNNQILAGEDAFKTVNLEFISNNGSWNIDNNLNTKNIILKNSSLYLTGKNITATNIDLTLNGNNVVDFTESKISGVDKIEVSSANEVIFKNSLIAFSGAIGNPNKTINGNGNVFHNVQLLRNAALTINGNNSFNKILVNGVLKLTGDNTIDSLRLSDVSSLTLKQNSTQTINNLFDATGSVGNFVEIRSDGSANAAIFADNSNIRFCFDYLDVVNVSVSGATGFLSGNNSKINNNSTGWIELDCDEALFPSFDIEFPCALGEVRFIDTSTGFPTEWSWDFGNLQFPDDNNSVLQNPFHNFRFEGDYEINFNVKNDQFDETITRTVTIIEYESGLSVPSINVDGTRLTASVIAPNYQWFLNNQPIPGAIDRILEVPNPGLYQVTVSDENCLFLSEGVSVTALEKLGKSGVNLYPNPTSNFLTIQIDNKFNGKIELLVYDLLGNNLLRDNFTKDNQLIEKQISTSSLSGGLYNLVIIADGNQFIRKFVVTD